MGTICAPLIADLFKFGYQRDFITSLSDDKADIFEAFNSTSRYLGDLLNIDNPYFEGMVNGFEGWIWVLIASVPDLCILITFSNSNQQVTKFILP